MLANAMADIVKMDLLGFRQIFRQAIFTSMDMLTFWGSLERTA